MGDGPPSYGQQNQKTCLDRTIHVMFLDGSSHLSEMVSYDWRNKHPLSQREFQEVLYHILGHILWGYSLNFRPYIGLIYGRYLHFRILEWPLN